MKKLRRNFQRGLLLHKLCGICVYRETMNYIQFKDGFVYCTNANVAVKLKMSEVSDFNEEEINITNGKFIHKNAYSEILKYDIVEIDESGFNCKKDGVSVLFQFQDIKGYPDVDSVFNYKNECKAIKKIGINQSMYSLVMQGLPNKGFDYYMEFNGEHKAITLKNIEFESKGIIMPFLIK